MKEKLVEGEDFYYTEEGLFVMTRKYHLDRGFCCGNGCKHCPYKYENVQEPKKSELLRQINNEVTDR
ncbi:MAG TPA: DUF5522 domain-containing protein [Segetibacter sp.]